MKERWAIYCYWAEEDLESKDILTCTSKMLALLTIKKLKIIDLNKYKKGEFHIKKRTRSYTRLIRTKHEIDQRIEEVRMKHTHKSPFPCKMPDGRILIDEKCACGCRRSEHEDTPLEYGHGKGPAGCERFTWVDRIYMGRKES
jgi:hypothetical protein